MFCTIEEDTGTAQQFPCPKCSAVFSGKAFLNFHLKKAHANVGVSRKPPDTVKVNFNGSTQAQGSHTKNRSSERIFPPEIASRVIKFSSRRGDVHTKHLTLNGYAFVKSKDSGPLCYWRCKLTKNCSCTITENSAIGTFARGVLGWASDGLTHLSHAPDFKK
jgi:hypothetical protein